MGEGRPLRVFMRTSCISIVIGHQANGPPEETIGIYGWMRNPESRCDLTTKGTRQRWQSRPNAVETNARP